MKVGPARFGTCLALLLSGACFEEHGSALDPAGGAAGESAASVDGIKPLGRGGTGGMSGRDRERPAGRRAPAAGPDDLPATPGIALPDAGAAPRANGHAGCGALRDPMVPLFADTAAFSGVGGAGFALVGMCDGCGWDHASDACSSLVKSVPAIDNPHYARCIMLSLAWVSCLESHSCICDGSVPMECESIKAEHDQCVGWVGSADD